ncbi:MAG: Tat pathway signal protein [Variovorax sp.]|nr:Tat pathway signal protein [Variovorax sp.]
MTDSSFRSGRPLSSPASAHFPGVQPDNASRREFLRRTGALSLAASATPWALSLAAMGEAAAATAGDYKALVCVFLYGGNDYANTLVGYDQATYNVYNSLRSNIAIGRDLVAPTVLAPTTALPNGRQYALAPTLAPLLPIFNAGALSIALNVGTLVQPTTKAQYNARSVPLPPKLFSHNDQSSYWQASAPEGASSGWGGRMGDLLAGGNGNSTFTCVSVSGNAVYLSGNQVSQYQVASSGPVAVSGIKSAMFGSSACSAALNGLMTNTRTQLLENSYAAVSRRALTANDQLSSALAAANVATAFPAGNSLADQLKLVARMISVSSTLGAKRQVFFVSMGGFDNHDGLGGAGGTHALLLAAVANAMSAFYQATKDLGVSQQVTTFTASDFGRTLNSNSSGSDHGWGGVQFVMGDAVKGKSFIGAAPTLANDGPDDVGQGRLVPTTGVDQFGATLANWFGVSPNDQLAVLPNLKNYSTRNLGFMD